MTNINEYRGVRIVGTYTPIGGAATAVDRIYMQAMPYDVNGVPTSMMGTQPEQDITPSFQQASAGETAFNVVAPIASDVFASFTGAHGLEESSDQPADTSRPFYGTADMTRAHHIGAQLMGAFNNGTYGRGNVGMADIYILGTPLGVLNGTHVRAMIQLNGGGYGVIVEETAGVFGLYYAESGTYGDYFGRTLEIWNPTPTTPRPYAYLATNQTWLQACQIRTYKAGSYGTWIISGTANQIKMLPPVNSVATPSVVQAVQGPPQLIHQHGDRLHVFSGGAGQIVVEAFDVNGTTGALTHTQNAVPANVSGNLFNEDVIVGICNSKGYMIVACPNNLYSLAWDDTNHKYTFSLIQPIPLGVTGAPVEFGGDVYVPCGNRLFRFTVGGLGNTWATVDPNGTMPAPYDGNILQLIPTHDALYARIVKGTTMAAMLRVDNAGAFSTIDWSDTADDASGVASLSRGPVVPILSQIYGSPYYNCLNYAGGAIQTTWRTRQFPSGTRYPRARAAIDRQQIGDGWTVGPWQYGTNRHAKKTAMRASVEVDDLGDQASGLGVDIYIQRDDEHKGAATFATGPAQSLGALTLVANVYAGSAGVDATTGSGIFWTELTAADGRYPTARRRYRLVTRVHGDATGAKYPELRSLVVQRYEWILKSYLTQYKLTLQVGAGADGDADLAMVYETSADLEAALADLKGLSNGQAIALFYDAGSVDGVAYHGVISKINIDPQNMDFDGRTKVGVMLSVQHAIPTGIYADTVR